MDGFRPIVIPPGQPTPDGATPGAHGPAALLPYIVPTNPAAFNGTGGIATPGGKVSILIGL